MGAFDFCFVAIEVVVIVLYAFCTTYGEGVHPAAQTTQVVSVDADLGIGDSADEVNSMMEKDVVQQYYPLY
jgi:hypothetical protein